MESKKFIADEQIRLDQFLSKQLDQSRNQIEQLIKKGYVQIEGKSKVKTGLKLSIGEKIVVDFPIIEEKSFNKEEFLQNADWADTIEIIYEDEHMLVVNKPSGVVVHDAPSVKEATLVDWLKYKNISLSTISGEERHGIVHRLDKGTSGLMVVAKTNEAHENLAAQLQDKSMGRYYLAFIDLPLKDEVVIEAPIGRNPNNRLKMGVVSHGKYAKTSFKKITVSDNGKYELIAAKLYTGRTHQIRVHLEKIHRHILGDSLYGFKGNLDKFSRVYLHAFGLYLFHPFSKDAISFCAPFPKDMQEFYNHNFDKDYYEKKVTLHYISDCFNNTV
jgi:23S rRNA pseudouridine1911/1915/1917 synthase